MAILEANTDLDVKGRVLATNVPNSTGSIVTWNATTNVFGLRTNSQILSDLGLTSVVNNSHTHNNKSVLDGITSTNVNNWNTAFGWGNFRDYGLGIKVDHNSDANDSRLWDNGFYTLGAASINRPSYISSSYASGILTISETSTRRVQIATGGNQTERLSFRSITDSTQGNWLELWHSGNLTNVSQLNNDAGYLTSSTAKYIAIGNGSQTGTSNGNAETLRNGSIWSTPTTGGIPSSNGAVVSFNPYSNGAYGFQLGARANKFYGRTLENGTLNNWVEFIHTGNISSNLSGYVPTSRTLTAGNGLSGGGNLTTNRTITLGTPSAIGLSTTNAVTSTSHTHALDSDTISEINKGQQALTAIGVLNSLTTTDKSNLVNAINEVNGNIPNVTGFVPYTGANQPINFNTQKITHNGIVSNVYSITSPWLISTYLTSNNKVAYLIIDGFTANTHRQLYIEVESVAGNGEHKRIVKGFIVNFTNVNILSSSVDSRYLEVTGYTGARYGIGEVEKHSDTALKIPLIWIASAAPSINKISVKAYVGSVSNLTFSIEYDATSTLTTEDPYLYRNASEKWVEDNYVPINGVTTINNTKTFTSSPIVPNATLNGHAVNLGQVNSLLPTVNDGQLSLTTGTGLSGSATFTANQSGNSTFSVAVASTHKLPTITEWNALPTTDTITRLRGTTSGTYTSGDLTLLAGANTTITQSGSNITIASTNTTHTGDVTGSTALTIANNAVTHAKYQNIATQRILGRGAAGTGNVQELTLGANLSLSTAGVLSATNTNTTYSAGTGLSLSGTTFGQTITTSGTGTFVTGITQTTNGFQINLGTPPNTNTTYSAGTLALLTAGTNTSNRVWSPKILADGLIRKGVHNVNPAGEAFSIYANYGTLDWDGNGFTFSTDHGSKFNYIDDEQAIGVNIYESYGFYLNNQRLRFTSNNINSELLPANGESNSKLPVTGAAGRVLAIGATNGSTTEYADTNGVINISSLVNQSTGNFVSKSGVNIIDYTGWALDAGVRFTVGEAGINVLGNESSNPDADHFSTSFEVNVDERFIGMYSGGTNPAGFKILHNTKGYSNLKAPDSVTTARVIPIGIKQKGDIFYSDTEGVINLPTSASNTTFHNNTHNSTSGNQTVTLTNTSYPKVERVFYSSGLCGTLTINKYAPVDGDEIIVQGRQCTIVIKKSSSVSHTIFTPSSHNLVTSITLVSVCITNSLQSVHLRYMSNYQSWVVLSASITTNGYFV